MQNFAKICYFTKFRFRENGKFRENFPEMFIFAKNARQSPKSFSSRENNPNFFQNRKNFVAAALIYSCFIHPFVQNFWITNILAKICQKYFHINAPFVSHAAKKLCLFCNKLKEKSTLPIYKKFAKIFGYFRKQFSLKCEKKISVSSLMQTITYSRTADMLKV